MLKKTLSILLSLCILFGVFTVLPISAYAQDMDIAEVGLESTGNSTLDAFINDSRWTNGASWAYDKMPIIASFQAWGCCAYCADYVKYCYGVNNPRSGAAFYSVSEIRAGDVLTVGNQSDGTGHWFVCLKRSGNSLYVAEGNYSNKVRIGWNYTISGSKFAEDSRSFTAGYHYLDPQPDPTPQGHVMSESEGAGQTIPDGDYWICSRIAQDYFIDVPGDDFNTGDGKNLQTWIWNPSLSLDYLFPGKWDVFHLTYLNNGYYRITQYNTNMAIDVEGASLNRGTNVQMWESNGTNAQQWSIEKSSNGYKLRSRCNAYCLDVDGGTYSSGTNVKVWEDNDSNAQYYGFIPYSPDEKPFADGVYTIVSALKDTCYLDVSGVPGEFVNDSNVQIWNNSDIWGHPDEKFRFEYVGYGYYRIYEATSNLLLEIYNNGSNFLDNHANAKLYGKTSSRGQLWRIKKLSDGTYCFMNQMSGYCLDVNGAETANGTNVSQYAYNGTTAQRWKPLRVLQDDMVTVNDVSITSDDTAVTPQVTVKVDNTTLKANTDYTVTTTADIASGKGTVTVKGKGNYCNTITKEYKISCTLLDKAVTVNDIVITSDITEVNPKVTVKANNKTLKVDTDYTLTSTADIANGTGTVTVTGKNGYTGTITKNFKITVDDRNKITDSMGNQYYANQGEIVTFIINLTSPRQVNYLNGILYYNQDILEPIITDDIGYHAPNFVNGQFHILTPGQIEFDVYSNTPVSLNNTTIVKMQFRLTAKGKEGWLAHEFKTPEFTWDNQGNYGLETRVLTNQELYDPHAAILGDIDDDGEVGVIDATYIQRYDAGFNVPISEEDILLRGDVDGDEEVTVIDATYIQRFDAGFNIPYPVGEAIA